MFTNHPEYRAFVAQMREHPDDDVVRLAAADWLDERGEADRAEFVRVQVECVRIAVAIANGTESSDYPHRAKLHKRGWALLKDHVGNWFGSEWRAYPDSIVGLLRVNHEDGRQYDLDRGFVESVTCPAAAWLAHGDAVRAAHPVTRVTLTTVPDGETSYDTADHGYDEMGARLVGDSSVAPWFPMSECWAKGDGRYLRGLLRLRWPGVEFTLPPEPGMDPPPLEFDFLVRAESPEGALRTAQGLVGRVNDREVRGQATGTLLLTQSDCRERGPGDWQVTHHFRLLPADSPSVRAGVYEVADFSPLFGGE